MCLLAMSLEYGAKSCSICSDQPGSPYGCGGIIVIIVVVVVVVVWSCLQILPQLSTVFKLYEMEDIIRERASTYTNIEKYIYKYIQILVRSREVIDLLTKMEWMDWMDKPMNGWMQDIIAIIPSKRLRSKK